MKKAIAMAMAAMMAVGVMAQKPVEKNVKPEGPRPMMQRVDTTRGPRMMEERKGPRDLKDRRPDAPRTKGERRDHDRRDKDRHDKKHEKRTPEPLKYNADGIETTILKPFPEAKRVEKQDKMTKVYNAQDKCVGYVVYSKPASDNIRGYNGETPVMIALNKSKKIIGVYMLPNIEGGKFVQSVSQTGLLNQWNGLSIKQAKKKTVDTVSGATFTSRSLIQSVQAALAQF